jgi:hypothetical protein
VRKRAPEDAGPALTAARRSRREHRRSRALDFCGPAPLKNEQCVNSEDQAERNFRQRHKRRDVHQWTRRTALHKQSSRSDETQDGAYDAPRDDDPIDRFKSGHPWKRIGHANQERAEHQPGRGAEDDEEDGHHDAQDSVQEPKRAKGLLSDAR